MRALATLALAASASVLTAAAKPSADASLSPTYRACMDRADGVTLNMHDCLAAEFSRQDARLNAAYKAVMSSLQPPRRTALRDEERGWLQRMKTRCGHAGDADAGGSLQPIEIDQCYAKATAQRADMLTAMRR